MQLTVLIVALHKYLPSNFCVRNTWSMQWYPTAQSARDAQHHPSSLMHVIVLNTSTRPVIWDKTTNYLQAHINAYASLGDCRVFVGDEF